MSQKMCEKLLFLSGKFPLAAIWTEPLRSRISWTIVFLAPALSVQQVR